MELHQIVCLILIVLFSSWYGYRAGYRSAKRHLLKENPFEGDGVVVSYGNIVEQFEPAASVEGCVINNVVCTNGTGKGITYTPSN